MGGRFFRRGVFFALLCACAGPARAADPILMFLIGIAREMVQSHLARTPASAPVPAPAPAPSLDLSRAYPGTLVEPEHLRQLIDESFVYLSESQRREIFDSLHASLMEPKNAAVRAEMIEFFAYRARAIRAAQIRLAQLSWREKEQIALDFKREVAALPQDEQARFAEVLRRGLLPVPGDLNQLLLGALDAR